MARTKFTFFSKNQKLPHSKEGWWTHPNLYIEYIAFGREANRKIGVWLFCIFIKSWHIL